MPPARQLRKRVGHLSSERRQLAGRRPRDRWQLRHRRLGALVAAVRDRLLGRARRRPRRTAPVAPDGVRPQQSKKSFGQSPRRFRGCARVGLERLAHSAREHRADQIVRADAAERQAAYATDLLSAGDEEHVRQRRLHRRMHERARSAVLAVVDDEHAPAAPQRVVRRADEACRDWHEAVEPRQPRKLDRQRCFARTGRAPDGGDVRPRARHVRKHLGKSRDGRSLNRHQSPDSERHVGGRFRLRIADLPAADIGNDDRRALPHVYGETVGRRETSRAKTIGGVRPRAGSGLDRPAPRRSTLPRFESNESSHEAVVKERRDCAVMESLEQIASRRPLQLRRSSDDSRHLQHDTHAGCEIDDTFVVVHRKAIRHELHRDLRCR